MIIRVCMGVVVCLGSDESTVGVNLALFSRYTLSLSDTQVVVCKVNDKWSQVTSQSFSAGDLHVVEKFTISVQMERYSRI